MIFKHFLATRFNVRIGGWDTTKNGEVLLDDSWMDNRFELFENYCLPSVINQSNQSFTWCIYFDLHTREVYRQRIKKLTESYPNIRIFFIDSIGELKPHLINFIKSNVKGNSHYVITSRLDTDDLLHRDYIKVVQQLFEPSHTAVIDLRNGFKINIEEGGCEIRNYTQSFNPFISLIEKTEFVETVFNQMHHEWYKAKKVIPFCDRQLWIELVHKKNWMNSANHKLDYSLKFNETEFGIHGKIALNKDSEYYVNYCRKKSENLIFFSKSTLKRGLKVISGKQ
jgi:hypothetical protein